MGLPQKLENLVHISSSNDHLALTPSQRWMRATTWGLVGTGVLGVAWLALAQTEEIITVPGKLEPVSRVSEVQIPVNGVVAQVQVKEGERVSKGQVLLTLDTATSRQRENGLGANIRSKQQQLVLKQDELRQFQQQNAADQAMLQNSLALEQDIASRLASLEQQGASAKLQLLQQRAKVVQTRGQLEKAKIERRRQTSILEQQIQELVQQSTDLQGNRTEQVTTLRYQQVRSPVDGVVFDLKARSPGFVSNSTEAVLKVVPQTTLVAAVEIPSSDIGFVSVGQAVDLSIDSYPATDFGVLQGRVKSLGSDALPPEPGDATKATMRYPGLISLVSQHLTSKQGLQLTLQPGMSLSANIKLRKVSYLQLLLGAFKSKAESLQRI